MKTSRIESFCSWFVCCNTLDNKTNQVLKKKLVLHTKYKNIKNKNNSNRTTLSLKLFAVSKLWNLVKLWIWVLTWIVWTIFFEGLIEILINIILCRFTRALCDTFAVFNFGQPKSVPSRVSELVSKPLNKSIKYQQKSKQTVVTQQCC